MTVIASLTNPIWQDTGVNVRVFSFPAIGRYEVRYPLISGETGIPDFTTPSDAISYAEHVAKTMRFTRNVAHGVAEKEAARRAVKTTRLDLVLRDRDGDKWILIGSGRYLLADGVISGTGVPRDRARIEKTFGPLFVEHSVEIKGELA